MRHVTPLRYPGGKAHLSRFFADLVRVNGLSDGAYVEPYAGGAGVGVSLLLGEYVDSVWMRAWRFSSVTSGFMPWKTRTSAAF